MAITKGNMWEILDAWRRNFAEYIHEHYGDVTIEKLVVNYLKQSVSVEFTDSNGEKFSSTLSKWEQ